ncbi:MAG: SDR family oxidoreductase [Phototrophicales bacterium]
MKKTALILGATGTAGRTLTQTLAESDEWHVIAVSRRITQDTTLNSNITPLAIDLLQGDDVIEKLRHHPITHVFYAAYIPEAGNRQTLAYSSLRERRKVKITSRLLKFLPFLYPLIYQTVAKIAGAADTQQKNYQIFNNVLQAVTQPPHQLQHVVLVTGAKYYGMHLTPYFYPGWSIPMRETDPRAPGPNFYFEQEDMLEAYANQYGFSWNVVRPSFIIGFANHSQNNLLTTLAVYISLLKAQQMPLIFPGDLAAADCLHTITDARLLADFMEWTTQTPAAQNQAFNVVNKEPFRWRDLWHDLAEYFGMQPEFPQKGFPAAQFMLKHTALWQKIAIEHDLRYQNLTNLTQPNFLIETFIQDYDVVISMDKATKAGFNADRDPLEAIIKHFDDMRVQRIIP